MRILQFNKDKSFTIFKEIFCKNNKKNKVVVLELPVAVVNGVTDKVEPVVNNRGY